MTMRTRLLFSVMLAFLCHSLPVAANPVMTPQNIFELRTVAETSISPDQQFIAFTLNIPRPFDHPAGGDYRELYVYDIRRNDIIPFITGNRSVSDIGWTPSGDAVTFRASLPQATGTQVYSMSLRGGDALPLTNHSGGVMRYAFIDDRTLAIVSADPADPRQLDLRRKGFDIEVFEEEFRHLSLYRYDLISHQTKKLTHDVTVFDFVLSPDGKWAAAAIAPKNLVDDSYMFKRIHLVNMESGETTLLVDNPGKLGNMAFSPDGKKLAFRSASKLEDSVVGSLFVSNVPNDRKFEELPNLVKGMELSVIDFAWKDNNTLIYAAEEGVDIVLSEQVIDRENRKKIIEPGKIVFGGFNLSGNYITMSANTWQYPNELHLFNLQDGSWLKLTDHNAWVKDVKLGEQKKLVYKARDGKEIEGVLNYPLNYERGKRYPLIVFIHGGPEAAVQNGWATAYNRWGQIAAARGYFVFSPNYRASSGRGVDFTMAGYGDLVGVEYEDVLDGIDHLINVGYVDRERVGIGGGSYGGYFAAWSATKYTDRFAASVVFVGISNQISKRNTTDIPLEDYYVHWGYWTHENYEDVYSRSPVKYAHQSLTPTLILHGKDDPRVPASQGLELYRTLQLHGKAPVRLIWYNGEGHGNRRNVHRLDYIVRTMDWFDHYLRLDKPRNQMPAKYPDYGVY